MTRTALLHSTLTVLLSATIGAPAQAAAAPTAAPVAAPAPAAAPAEAPAPAAAASVSVTSDPAAATPAATTSSASTPWIQRHRPTRNSWELGIYGGVFLPSPNHEFYAPDLGVSGFGHQPLARAGADIGLRAGYYPLSFLGLEIEGGLMPIKVADGSRATMYALRPVVLAQLPYRIAPFLRVGVGMLGISSTALGKDIDASFNVGGGVKFSINRLLALRLDIVDNIATAYGVGRDRANNLEILLGLSLRLGKKPKQEPAPQRSLIDSDLDGLYDPGQPGVAPADEDACPQQPGPRENRGCPWLDSDGDGMYDPGQGGVPAADVDACPQQPGPRENVGCPLLDSDGDILLNPGQPVSADKIDACPKEPGPIALQGCPDSDNDKIPNRFDKCPTEPETVNQYHDADGCADEVPKAVEQISGVLEGIYFDVDKDTIKPKSKATLDRALEVLKKFNTTRWRIAGHTDSDGNREHNLDLSLRRAGAVRQYLIDRGIDGSRLTAQGYGPDEPIDSNETKKGKARNRRIEFKLD